MNPPFAIYVRVSEVGDREDLHSPEDQEAAARAWAERHGEAVYFEESECVDLDVSGALAPEDRKLGALITRCESGEFAGIIVRYESRFARDTIAGGAALDRLVACGARLIATASGFDSGNLTPDSRMVFEIMTAVGQAERGRNRGARMGGKLKQAKAGVYCAPAPFGYDKDDAGRLLPNEDADLVREIFRRRAEGEGFSDIAREMPMTRTGVRRIILNKAYLGEQRVPDPDKPKGADTIVLAGNHPPLVTLSEWEAANAIEGRPPTHTGLGAEVALKGIVRCGVCGGTMHVVRYGKAKDKLTYGCTASSRDRRGGCTSMAVTKVEPAVLHQLDLAIAAREPHIAAIIEGDTRYGDALAAVEEAQAALTEYRDSIELQRELGPEGFVAGLRVRKEAVETARRALRDLPRPEPTFNKTMSLDEFDADYRRRFYRRAIAEVMVFPKAHGERLFMRWNGSDEIFAVSPFEIADLEAEARTAASAA